MRTIERLEVNLAESTLPAVEAGQRMFLGIERKHLLLMALALVVGFGARTYKLGGAGLAEDESNKVFALRAYAHGDLTANAEHPMLMKVMCYGSVKVCRSWNESAGRRLGLAISEEGALRLPNALFGTLTVIPLFLLATALLGDRVGQITAVFWALGLDAIWFNRIAKEDTLLVFFMFSAYYLYNLAKRHPESDRRGTHRLYAAAGAAFGLMIASKYFVHFFALNSLYYTLISYDRRDNRPVGRRGWSRFFAAMLLAFTVANPALVLPQTWRYLWRYLNEELLTHHGYMVMGKLFINDMTQTPGGNPWYFYPLFLGVKLPLPLLIAFLAGLVEVFRRRGLYPHSRGYLFLRVMLVFWLFPMSVVGTKFLRYSLSLMPLLYMTSAVGVVALWRTLTHAIGRTELGWPRARRLSAVAVAVAFVAFPCVTAVRAVLASHPGLYLNQAGGGRVGFFFPHDEFYDLGARESIKYIADTAPYGARMASEIPGVVQYYLELYGRADIGSEIISQPRFSLTGGRPDYVLLQRGRVYVENVESFRVIERDWHVVQSSNFDGFPSSLVYCASDAGPAALAERSPR